MSELSFLLDLIINEKIPKKAKDKILERIKEIEQRPVYQNPQPQFIPRTAQAPSTQKILDEMAMNPAPIEPLQPASPAAALALAERQKSIAIAVSGKAEPGRTSPRKF